MKIDAPSPKRISLDPKDNVSTQGESPHTKPEKPENPKNLKSSDSLEELAVKDKVLDAKSPNGNEPVVPVELGEQFDGFEFQVPNRVNPIQPRNEHSDDLNLEGLLNGNIQAGDVKIEVEMFPNVAGGGPDPAHALDAPMEDIVSGHVGQSVEVSVVTIRNWIAYLQTGATEFVVNELLELVDGANDATGANAPNFN
ncbi:hypothetical protein B9Z55_015861 [Caenorhabditis nigoni]|nr:hypothetical protein B9Z55_015861 [Caenorhabditis nigoni]